MGWAKMGKGKPKLTSEERSRRVAHKKLKLAARARFERTLQYVNAVTNTVVDANMGSSSLISFIMTPAPEENSVVLQPLKKSKLKVPAEASIFYLKRWLTNNLQGPDSEKLKVKDMQILCRELVLSNERHYFRSESTSGPKIASICRCYGIGSNAPRWRPRKLTKHWWPRWPMQLSIKHWLPRVPVQGRKNAATHRSEVQCSPWPGPPRASTAKIAKTR